MNDPARTARLQAALATLEEATADPMMLAGLSPEELARLRRAAGEIFSPDVDLRRRISRARARGQKVAQIEREQAKLDQTGIRKLRREPIFTAPNLSPPVGFVPSPPQVVELRFPVSFVVVFSPPVVFDNVVFLPPTACHSPGGGGIRSRLRGHSSCVTLG